MSTTMPFDDDLVRRLVEVYTTPDVVGQREATLEILDLKPGEHVLDIGSGPGFLAASMAERVGADGAVFGIDLSEPMLAHANSLPETPGAAPMTFALGDATTLEHPDATFDAAVCTQVYEYVPDIGRALEELHRVLKPGGRALVLDTDWDTAVWHTNDRARMARVMSAWEEHLADPWLPRTLARRLESAGLAVERQEILQLANLTFDERTYSAGMMGFVANFVPGHRGVTQEEAAAWLAELRELAERDEYFFSINRYLFLARRVGPA
jgi:ubiquinone/menaquinone biosynthesis C-methylase UbiE